MVQTGYAAHPLSYLMGTREFFPLRVKRHGREAHHSPPTIAKVKKTWSYAFNPAYVLVE
jgi:hypothetical protein